MKQHTFRRILRYLLPKWFLLIFVLLFSTASVLLNLYTTVLIGEGVDYIVGMGDVDFDAIIRELNQMHYHGPLCVEWEDSGMERMFGAQEACEFAHKINFEPSDVAFDAALKSE